MKKLAILLFLTMVVFLAAGMMSSVSAIIITPDTEKKWSGDETANFNAGDIATKVGFTGTLYELYKENVGDGFDTGSYAPYYETEFYNDPLDPQDATITWDGSPDPFIGGDPLYLYVKDGGQTPAWYIFDLTELYIAGYSPYYSWDGKDALEMQGFWPNQGAISHVAIYGTTPIPEPATLLLLGSGLIGLAGIGRRKFFKKS